MQEQSLQGRAQPWATSSIPWLSRPRKKRKLSSLHILKSWMTHHSFRCRSGEVMWWLISMPIMERCSSDAQPQEHTDNVHDGIRKLSLMPRRSEEISEQLYRCVNHVSHKDTWSDYLGIRGLLLVEVPCSSDTQEVAAITESVQNQNDDVQNLVREKRNLKLVIYQHNRPHQPLYQPHLVDDFKGYDKGE